MRETNIYTCIYKCVCYYIYELNFIIEKLIYNKIFRADLEVYLKRSIKFKNNFMQLKKYMFQYLKEVNLKTVNFLEKFKICCI